MRRTHGQPKGYGFNVGAWEFGCVP
jgi:hypothetical protein